jgi:hypothetical protein
MTAKVSGVPAIISGHLPGQPAKASGVTRDTRGVGRVGDGNAKKSERHHVIELDWS